MKRFILTAILALVFITTSAHAADKGMYVSGNLGFSLLSDSTASIPGIVTAQVSFDLGFRVGGALGYDFGAYRVEGEIAYRLNDTDAGTVSGGPGPVFGEVSATSFMANGYYDFPLANAPWVPYLGFGVGFANIDADITAPLLSPLALIDDSAIVFAWQIMAGFGYNISSTTTLTADYRYFVTADPEFSPGPAFPGLPDIESDYGNHSFNFGARFAF